MGTQIKNHLGKLVFVLLLLNIQLLLTLSAAEPKAWAEIDWLDIVGEGGAVWLCLVWLVLLLAARPDGPVTQLLFWGFSCFLLATGQDLLDEVLRMPATVVWKQWVESIPMPIGMALMSAGLYQWYREQQVLNRQLLKRERGLRDHRCMDRVTGLGNADYLRRQLALEIQQGREQQLPTALLMLDIDDFRGLNRRLGMAEGDRLLGELTELLLLNLRRRDLLCRYAGDRFAIVLPATCQSMAELMAEQLEDVCKHFAFRARHSDQAQFHTVSIGLAVDGIEACAGDPAEALIERANYRLAKAKDSRWEQVA